MKSSIVGTAKTCRENSEIKYVTAAAMRKPMSVILKKRRHTNKQIKLNAVSKQETKEGRSRQREKRRKRGGRIYRENT